jgi:hypothetical protein
VQAHITQLSSVGWLFGASATKGKDLVYVTLVSPDRRDFTIIVANTGSDSASFAFNITAPAQGTRGAVAAGQSQVPWATVDVWRTVARKPFYAAAPLPITADGILHASVPGSSVASFTTIRDAMHAEPVIPPRTSFPLPYRSNYSAQVVGQEGQYLSAAFGSFSIFDLPQSTPHTVSSPRRVLRQGSVGCPVGWDTPPGETRGFNSSAGWVPNCLDLPPFATLPSGTNWRNYNISVMAALRPFGMPSPEVPRSATPSADEVVTGPLFASLCGRIPVW